jgi:hypothetical protein
LIINLDINLLDQGGDQIPGALHYIRIHFVKGISLLMSVWSHPTYSHTKGRNCGNLEAQGIRHFRIAATNTGRIRLPFRMFTTRRSIFNIFHQVA